MEPDREDDGRLASALVILHAADRAEGARVQDQLRSLGFDVGALIGTSFSISAPAELFARSFGEGPPTAADQPERVLPADRLSDEAAGIVEAIVFTPPPDFGPGAP